MQSMAEHIWTFSYYLFALLLRSRINTYENLSTEPAESCSTAAELPVSCCLEHDAWLFWNWKTRTSWFDLNSCESVGSAADFFFSVSGTGFVSPADLPLDEEEDVEQAMCACLKLYSFPWKHAVLGPVVLSSHGAHSQLGRYKVPQLKLHPKDMLALARTHDFRIFRWPQAVMMPHSTYKWPEHVSNSDEMHRMWRKPLLPDQLIEHRGKAQIGSDG